MDELIESEEKVELEDSDDVDERIQSGVSDDSS
jgi:hypothetical protein